MLTASRKLVVFAADIKIGHTVFAMPFALLSAVLAGHGDRRIWGKLGLIVLCMVTARTVAMAANRLLDARLDALNPRTARRAIPSGALSRGFVRAALGLCAALFSAGAAGFWLFYGNPWPAALALPVLAFLAAYPLLKRFSRLCHFYLGAALALAPVCAYLAVAGHIAAPPLWMAGAVLLWTAGFDIIYACQDYHSDVQTGVISIPVKMGIARALWVSRLTHAGSLAMLLMVGRATPQFGGLYFTGVVLAGALLVVEHALVSENDLSKAGVAFFTMNGLVSVLLGALGIIDILR